MDVYSDSVELKFTQSIVLPDRKRIDSFVNWIVLTPDLTEFATRFVYGDILVKRSKRGSDPEQPMGVDLPNAAISHVAFAVVKAELTMFELLTLARKVVSQQYEPKKLGLIVSGFEGHRGLQVAEALLAAVLASSRELPKFKKASKPGDSKKDGKKTSNKDKSGSSLLSVALFGVRSSNKFRQTFAEAAGNGLARCLSYAPPNKLTPRDYLAVLRKLAKQSKWGLEFYDLAALRRKKAGAFLAVAQGSDIGNAGIVRLRYRPSGSVKKGIALVGKGICYDTGGVNLKPARYMFGMHEDMQGSAVALGVLLALTRLGYDRPVECWLALATNHIGPKAYKPNDVVHAADGSAIEIVHTDAEGRMVLADALVLASSSSPKLIIDFATLTGSCIEALGTAYSGIFTNKAEWNDRLISVGESCGERVWPFPLDDDYRDLLKSDVADIKQCTLSGGADHILAAVFLKNFIKRGIPWIHIDLSSSNCKGGLAHIPTDTTGFGVRYMLNLLLHEKLDL